MSRGLTAKKPAGLLDAVVNNNNPALWSRLLYFAQCCLQIQAGRRGISSLASLVNDQIKSAPLSPPSPTLPTSGHKSRAHKVKDPLETLATKVSAKIEAGNLRGAIRLVF